MIFQNVFRILVLTSAIFLGSSVNNSESGYTIEILVTNIRNNKGIMQIQLYTNQKSFEAEKPQKNYRFSKKTVSNGKMKCTITLKTKGRYGLALLDDENSNKKMDYGWMMPEEGFGFSDYYHTGWSRPEFSDFDFVLTEDKQVTMKVRYL